MSSFEDPIFDPKNEVKNVTIKFGKVGDAFKGTLLSVKSVMMFDKKKNAEVPKKVYEFKGHGGSFYDLVYNEETDSYVAVDEQTVVIPGNTYVLWSRGQRFDDDMKRAKAGTIVAFRFTGKTEAKAGKKSAKIVKVFVGGADPEYMGEDASDIAASFGGTEVPPM